MREKRMVRFAVILFLMLFLSGCQRNEQVTSSYTGTVSVTIGMGTRSNFAKSKKVSVEVDISGEYANTNNTITLTVPTNKGDFYCYRYPVKNVQSDRAVFVVPVSTGSSQMVIEILDERERVIYSRTGYYQFADLDENQDELIVGLIGNLEQGAIQSQNYSDGSHSYQIRTASIQPQNLLEIPDAYSPYSLLVIDADVIGQISEEQKEAILRWNESGGNVLFLGSSIQAASFGFDTGNRVSRYEIFEDSATYLSFYETQTSKFTLMAREKWEQQLKESDQLLLLTLAMDNSIGNELQETTDQSEFSNLMKRALDEQRTVAVAVNKYIYYIVFIIYLLILLPGGYLILRKKDRMRFFRGYVCILAVLSCAGIWLIGSRTRFAEPFLHSIAIDEYNGTEKTEQIYFSVQAPYNQSFSVLLNPDYRLEAMDFDEEWSLSVSNSYQRHTAELTQREEATELKLDNLVAFSARYFKMVNQSSTKEKITVSFGEDYESAELYNAMETDLTNVAIFDNDTLYLLETFEAGETIRLSEALEEGKCQQLSLGQFLYGTYQNKLAWSEDNKAIYNSLLEQISQKSTSGIYIIAKTQSQSKIQQETSYRQNYDTLVMILAQEE